MNINRNNYEIYFLDYYENNLAPEQVAELMVFLEANPDLKEEFESFETLSLVQDGEQFEDKNSLKKKTYKSSGQINSYNYEEWMVAAVEGDLSENEIEELNLFLSLNPDAKLEYNLFKKAVLTPDNVEVKDKESLKKKGVFLLYRYEMLYALSAAAVILLLLGVYFNGGNSSTNFNRDGVVLNADIQPIDVNSFVIDAQPAISFRNEFSDFHKRPAISEEMETTFIYSSSTITQVDNKSITEIDLVLASIDPEGVESRNEHFSSLNELIRGGQELMEQKSFTGRFIANTFEKVFGTRNSSQKSIIEYTIEGYNLMADREVEVEKAYDTSGNVIAYNINGRVLSLGRKVNPNTTE